MARPDNIFGGCQAKRCFLPARAEGLCLKHLVEKRRLMAKALSLQETAAEEAGVEELEDLVEPDAEEIPDDLVAALQDEAIDETIDVQDEPGAEPEDPLDLTQEPLEAAPQEIAIMSKAMVTCKVCGKQFKHLGRHMSKHAGETAADKGKIVTISNPLPETHSKWMPVQDRRCQPVVMTEGTSYLFDPNLRMLREAAEALGLKEVYASFQNKDGICITNPATCVAVFVNHEGVVRRGTLKFEASPAGESAANHG